MERIYHPQVSDNDWILLDRDRIHYLMTVLRQPIGATISIFDGVGSEVEGTLEKNKAGIGVRIESSPKTEPPPELKIDLWQAMPKKGKTETVVQKATELGVWRIVLFVAKRSVAKMQMIKAQKKIDRLTTVAMEACRQSGRKWLPKIEVAESLERLPFDAGRVLVANPAGGVALSTALGKAGGELAVMVGPEGGFDDEEMRIAIESGAQPVRLGPRILRTETAGPAILAAIQAICGDWK